MQHRSLLRRREWRPNTPAPEKSPVRYHSPYCEATGPIVQDGFVASRIRTLQALSNDVFKPIRSHSPMLECPGPWLHERQHNTPPIPESLAKSSVEGHDVPKSETSNDDYGNAVSNRSQELYNEVSAQRLIDLRLQAHQGQAPIELPESSALRPPHSDAVAIEDSTTIGRQTPSEDGILSPRAIPASLAEPSKAWRDISQAGSYHNDSSHHQNLRSKRSIADKLGSMVERGWVGCDVFGEAHNDREASESITSKSTPNDRVKRRSRSFGEHQQRTRPLPLKWHRSFSSSRVASNTRKPSVEKLSDEKDDHRYHVWKHAQPTPVHEAVKGITVGKKVAQRSSSDAELSGGESCAYSSSGRHRMWSLRSLSRLRRGQSQQFELERISSGHNSNQHYEKQDRKTINHFLSSGNTIREQEQEPQTFSDDHQDQGSQITSSSRRTSTNTTHSALSATRSGSWFKKYRFLPKLVPADNPPAIWDFSTEDSNGSAAIRANGDSQQDSSLQSDQHEASDSKTSGLQKHELRDADSKSDASLMDTCSSKEPGTTERVETMPQNVAPHSIEPRISASRRGSESSRMSEQIQSLTKPAPTACPLFADAETPLKKDERSPPKLIDYFSEHQDYPLPAPSPTQVKHPPKTRSTDMNLATAGPYELNGEEITQHSSMDSQASTPTASMKFHLEKSLDWISPVPNQDITPKRRSSKASPQRLGSDVAEFPLEHPADPTQSSPQVDEATQTVGRGRRASEKKIKKIQVTITLDGAEELVIEAKLQRRAGWEGWGMCT